MNETTRLPWHQKQWEHIAKKVPHAILIHGPAGTGKTIFAKQLAQQLLCQTKNTCMQCSSCQWFSASTHPDFFSVTPEEGKNSIAISQVRELSNHLTQTANAGGYQIALIQPAEKMTTAASNALLKTLEEPAGSVVLILVTDQMSRLPATILSRCQLLSIPAPKKEVALSWLKENIDDPSMAEQLLELADGRVMLAKKYSETDIIAMSQEQQKEFVDWQNGVETSVQIAAKWHKKDVGLYLELLVVFLMQLVRTKLYGVGHERHLRIVARWQVESLFKLLAKAQQNLSLVKSHANPNAQLMLEGLFVV